MVANEKWFGASAGFYPFEIGQSLRLDGDARLSHSHQSAPTLQTKATVSFWIKLHDNNDRNIVLHTGVGTSNNTHMTLALGASNSYQGISIGQYSRNLYAGSSTTPKQRDFTNFYHFFMKFDSTSSTASERVIKLYINGDEITDGTFTQMGQDDLFPLTAQTNAIYIGGHTPGYNYFTSGNIAELNVIDGQALDYTDFGESKNGVWIPKEYSGTYGNNGFRLTFEGNGTATTTDGTTAQTNIGDDQSGNGNNFSVYSSSVGSHDVVPDSPTNNFAVLNPLSKTSSTVLAEGNLQFTSSSYSYQGATSTIALPKTGKWYFECYIKTAGSATSHDFGIGIVSVQDDGAMSEESNNNTFVNGGFYVTRRDSGSRVMIDGSAIFLTDTVSVTSGQFMRCAFDADSGKIWFGRDTTWWNSSNGTQTTANAPSAGANQTGTLDANHEYIVHFNSYSNTYITVANFGQDSSFAGNLTSGSANASDANGIGDFYYDPPTDFLALCSANLPDTTISPNQSEQADDHFNTITWTGTGNGADAKTVGFQPDFIWGKDRQYANNHNLFDSSRGVQQRLSSSETSAESTETDIFQSFDSNGFTTIGQGLNFTNVNYVAWNWRCGGSSPTKTYKVVVVSDSGNKYRFRNSADSATFAQSAVTLDLQEGGTYVFDWSDSTAQGHPIRFSTTSDGTHGGGSEYTTGVVKDDSAYKTTITVAGSAPTLYYYCQNHSGMGGQVNTNTTHGSTNFDGSILSVVQTNSDAQFSIITGTTVNVQANDMTETFGHGLSGTPDYLIIKPRSASFQWSVWTSAISISDVQGLTLNSTGALFTNSSYRTVQATSSVVQIGRQAVENNSTNFVCYAFKEVEGYSKVGTYTGNGSTNGTFVFTGFRPAWVMIKQTNSTGSWVMHDNKRSPFNVIDEDLFANLSSAESDNGLDEDFISSGFKLRSSHSAVNGSGSTYIYMAFAEQPFKFSNAR